MTNKDKPKVGDWYRSIDGHQLLQIREVSERWALCRETWNWSEQNLPLHCFGGFEPCDPPPTLLQMTNELCCGDGLTRGEVMIKIAGWFQTYGIKPREED